MKFTRLEINNFLGIGHMEIEFDFNSLVLITGENRDSPVSTSNGSSKCLAGDTVMFNSKKSEFLTIEEMYNRFSKGESFSVNGVSDSLKLNNIEVTDVFKTGSKECLKIIFDDGGAVTVSKDHPLYSESLCCKKAREFSVGEHVASPRFLSGTPSKMVSPQEAYILGAYIGDGGTTSCSPVFTSADKEMVDSLGSHLDELFNLELVKRGDYGYSVRSKAINKIAVWEDILSEIVRLNIEIGGVVKNSCRIKRLESGFSYETLMFLYNEYGSDVFLSAAEVLYPARCFANFLDFFKINNCLSKNKRISSTIKSSEDLCLSYFLASLWNCDGYISKAKKKFGISAAITLASEDMIDDIKMCLLRLGVFSRKTHRKVNFGGKVFDSWNLTIRAERKNLLRFYDSVGIHLIPRKRERLEAILQREMGESNTNKDIIPSTITERLIREASARSGRPISNPLLKLSYSYSQLQNHCCSRRKVSDYATHFGEYGSLLKEVAESDLYWKKIVSIEDVGILETFDISVDSENHLYCTPEIVTHNSSIPEAILWCLYGTTKRGLKGDDVINRTIGSNCVVQVWFDSYRVERHRASDCGNSLRVFDGDSEITKGTNQATQELVEQIVGRGRLAFEKLFHFGQGDTTPLASMTDANLKTIFEESFNLGFIKDCFMRIKDEEKREEAELLKIEVELELLKREIDGVNSQIKELNELNNHFLAKKDAEITAVEKQLVEEQQLENNLKQIIDSYIKAGGSVRKAHFEELKKIASDNVIVLRNKLKELHSSMMKANSDYQVSLRDAKSYRDQLVALYEEKKKVQGKVGTPCPSCKKTIHQEDVDGVVGAINSKIETEASKIEYYKRLMAEADKEKAYQEGLLKDAEEALNKAMENEASHAVIWQNFVEYEVRHSELNSVKERIEGLKKQIEEIKAAENPIPNKLKMAADAIKAKRMDQKAKEQIHKDRAESLSLITVLGEIFGNQGLKSYIFDSITPRLNELINQYLHRLDNLSVEFTTQKQLKSGDLREKFDIIIQTENGPSSFDALSGGEKQRVSLAISLAMNKLMREIAGDPLNILFLDEVAEALDETSAEAVFGLIDDFAGDVENIFVISHNQALKDSFPTVLTVIKEGGLARIARSGS